MTNLSRTCHSFHQHGPEFSISCIMEFCFRYNEMKGHVAGTEDSPVNLSLTMMIYKSFKIGPMFPIPAYL